MYVYICVCLFVWMTLLETKDMKGNYKIEYKKTNKGNLELGMHKQTRNDLSKKDLSHTIKAVPFYWK